MFIIYIRRWTTTIANESRAWAAQDGQQTHAPIFNLAGHCRAQETGQNEATMGGRCSRNARARWNPPLFYNAPAGLHRARRSLTRPSVSRIALQKSDDDNAKRGRLPAVDFSGHPHPHPLPLVPPFYFWFFNFYPFRITLSPVSAVTNHSILSSATIVPTFPKAIPLGKQARAV